MKSIRIMTPVVLLLVSLLAAPSAAEQAARTPAIFRAGKAVTHYGTAGNDILHGTGTPR